LKKTWDVLGFGAVAVDDLLYVQQYPPVDSKQPVLSRERHAGGLAGTALVTVARLGGAAAFWGMLGQDELSEFTIQEFIREGVDCSLVYREEQAAPIHTVGIVERDSGKRTLFFDKTGVVNLPLSMITADVIAQTRVLYFDYTALGCGIHSAILARKYNIPTIVDLEPGFGVEITSLIPFVDHLVIGKELGEAITGQTSPSKMVSELVNAGFPVVVITAGDAGCWYQFGESEIQHIAALEVAVIDTVGCGDVFHGAYAYAIARGMEIDKAVRVATVAAGLKTLARGGRNGIPSWEEVSSIMKEKEI